MIWPGILGATLGVLNALWAIWRYFRDGKYVAWTFDIPGDGWNEDHNEVLRLGMTNAGEATAYDVTIATGVAPAPPHDGGDRRPSLPHVYGHERVVINPKGIDPVAHHTIALTWRERPHGRARHEVFDFLDGISLKPTRRQRIGARVAGAPTGR